MFIFEKKLLIPSDVNIVFYNNIYKISGPKGYIDYVLSKNLYINLFTDYLLIFFNKNDFRKKEVLKMSTILNTNYIIIKNHFYGVINLYSLCLNIVGIGYKAKYDYKLNIIYLYLGFSNPIEVRISSLVSVEVSDNVNITLKSTSKELLGKTALEIVNKKKADIYKGNGIKYRDEVIKFKIPKKSK